MNRALVYLDLTEPDGDQRRVDIAGDRLTIGRLAEANDLALDDPEMLITRYVHCLIERDGPAWWVVDNGSINGTYLQRDGVEARAPVQGRTMLRDGDTVCILASLADSDTPSYWRLTFRDPFTTRAAATAIRRLCLHYDQAQARLTRIDGDARTEVRTLRPLEHKLVRYMAKRNHDNGDVPVLCSVEELIAAVWDEEALHTPDELANVVWTLRQKVEPDRRKPRLLLTERKFGYRLLTCTEE